MLRPFSTPGWFEAIALPKSAGHGASAPGLLPSAPSVLTLSHMSELVDYWYMATDVSVLDMPSSPSPPSTAYNTLRLLLCSMGRLVGQQFLLEIIEVQMGEANNGTSPGPITIHRLQTIPRVLEVPLWGSPSICTGRGISLMIPSKNPHSYVREVMLYSLSVQEPDHALLFDYAFDYVNIVSRSSCSRVL
ncbi:hypothetical protein OE88DRAFT_1263285 [Heliocybe sulcata]|uniref:Uncharacterized protein n=1 Tax=Heliocybe sulcata TaxID=5364 RepID=A0A5C3N717_9AGAM|nr:hypothetical protein OE88DRAFT_1263285 [Heliocybe sulcata]